MLHTISFAPLYSPPFTHLSFPHISSAPIISLYNRSPFLLMFTTFNDLTPPFSLHSCPHSWSFSSHPNLSYTFPSLPSLFTSLPLSVSLQGKVAQTACMSACKHLSTSLMQMLLDTELKQISMGAIQQFNLDVIQCECEYKEQ